MSNLKVLSEDMMTNREYHEYVLTECERQWNENQADIYGEWEFQNDDDKEDYYNDMYSYFSDLLGKACCDCCYLAENNGKFTCNCGDSSHYEEEVQARNYCGCFEE